MRFNHDDVGPSTGREPTIPLGFSRSFLLPVCPKRKVKTHTCPIKFLYPSKTVMSTTHKGKFVRCAPIYLETGARAWLLPRHGTARRCPRVNLIGTRCKRSHFAGSRLCPFASDASTQGEKNRRNPVTFCNSATCHTLKAR